MDGDVQFVIQSHVKNIEACHVAPENLVLPQPQLDGRPDRCNITGGSNGAGSGRGERGAAFVVVCKFCAAEILFFCVLRVSSLQEKVFRTINRPKSGVQWVHKNHP